MTTAASKQDVTAIMEGARALRPLIESLRDEMETQRRMPPNLVEAMLDARLFHMLVPGSIGGLEADPLTCAQVIEEVARIDGSAGWNLMIGVGGGFFAGHLAEHVAKEVYGPRTVVAGAIAPTGQATVTDGGYRVRGRWSFGSGIHHATWVGGNCIIFDGEAPRMMAEGMPALRLMLVPASDCEIQDVWYVSGLRGTGSEDFVITDAFVPEERTFFPLLSEPRHDGPLYRLPLTYFLSQIATVPLGIARGAIDALVELATTKVPMRFGSRAPLRERSMPQVAVAKAEALLGSARAYFYEALAELWETVRSGAEATAQQRARLRIATCHAAASSAQAVDLVYDTGGATSIYNRSLLQRCFRDVHAATQHAAVAPDGLEDAGRVLFGLAPSSPVF